MFISIGIDEDGRPYITTSDGSREKVVRKGKGKSVIDFPSTYTVLDIETTGLDPRYCEIIEISAMKYSSGQNIGTFSTLPLRRPERLPFSPEFPEPLLSSRSLFP